MGLKGSDTADAGELWTPPKSSWSQSTKPHMDPIREPIERRAGVAADPPDAPVIQGWFQPRTDGPYGDPR